MAALQESALGSYAMKMCLQLTLTERSFSVQACTLSTLKQVLEVLPFSCQGLHHRYRLY